MGRGVLVVAVLLAGAQVWAEESVPCPHPYFPMADGLSFTYRAGKANVTVRFSDVSTEGATQKGTLHLEHKGRSGSTEAQCSAEGVRTELGGIEGAALSMSGMDVKVVASEGIALPPPERLVEGTRWENSMALELRPPSKAKIPFGVVKTTFRKESVVDGREKIEVAGRTFDAIRVKNTITAMQGTAGERKVESMMWLAPEVGILRIKTGDHVDFELLEIERPAVGGGAREGGARPAPGGAAK